MEITQQQQIQSDGIEVVKKSVYQYIENHINNYLLEITIFQNETLATYFHELNFNIIKYCEETYSVQSQYTIDFKSETETSNKDKNKLKQYSRATPNTPTLPKTTAKHLQTPEQGTKDFTSLRSPTRQQEPLQISSNLLDFLAENQSEHSETAANKENNSEITKEESIDSENEEDKMTTYIAKIPEFNGEDIKTTGDANRWNAARMLRTISYFLKGTAGEWFENLAAPFNDWNTFKAAFLEQFTDNNTSITLCNHFQNIKQKPSKSVMTYIGKFNKLLRRIRQLETNNYYSDAQILDQFIAGLKDKLIKKIHPHAPEDLNSAIQHTKRYEMTMEESNCTKLDFHHTAPSEGRAAAQQQNPSYTLTTIPPARIAENTNLSDIFFFEFEANKSPFLLSNVAANEQKAITAMYTEAEVEGKTIHLILDSGSARSIITYQLMQQLKRNVDRPAQTVIITANSMKKTPVREIDNFPFTLDGITIPVKVLIIDAPQYQALIGNDWLQKANANLNWETQELTISYQEQHARIPATCSTFNKCSEKAPAFEFEPEKEKPLIETFMALGSMSNWADKTEQKHFTPHSEPETSG
ncbi:hypothetical protein G9A89_007564 [Geosiphon pyriformis]|nr:hypothetical protein G9A89_007564 [Geosiphon pyriformis]